jgi:hypothetical protein
VIKLEAKLTFMAEDCIYTLDFDSGKRGMRPIDWIRQRIFDGRLCLEDVTRIEYKKTDMATPECARISIPNSRVYLVVVEEENEGLTANTKNPERTDTLPMMVLASIGRYDLVGKAHKRPVAESGLDSLLVTNQHYVVLTDVQMYIDGKKKPYRQESPLFDVVLVNNNATFIQIK